MEGWIKIHRKIVDNWIFNNDAYFHAWIVILMTVNYDKNKTFIHGEILDCDRGQSLLSLNSWASKFGRNWTVQKTRTFFSLLKKDEMINIEGLHQTTRLTVLNYETYQDVQQTNNTPITDQQHTDNTPITTTKEIKNKKEVIIKEKILKEKTIQLVKFENWLSLNAPLVLKMEIQITDENLTKMKKGFSLVEIQDILIKMHNYKPLLKKNIDAYLTATNWLNKNKTEKNERGNNFSKGKSISERSSSELAKEKGYGQLV